MISDTCSTHTTRCLAGRARHHNTQPRASRSRLFLACDDAARASRRASPGRFQSPHSFRWTRPSALLDLPSAFDVRCALRRSTSPAEARYSAADYHTSRRLFHETSLAGAYLSGRLCAFYRVAANTISCQSPSSTNYRREPCQRSQWAKHFADIFMPPRLAARRSLLKCSPTSFYAERYRFTRCSRPGTR